MVGAPMLTFLRELVNGRRGAKSRAAVRSKQLAPIKLVPAPAPPPPEAAPIPGADPFAPFGEALKLALPPVLELSPAESDQDQAAAEVVRAHFAANQPGPESFPALSLRVLTLLANPEVDIGELSRVISQDPAIAANVLRVANSAMYRGSRESQSVREAVARLGTQELARVAGVVSARSLFNPKVRNEHAALAPIFYQLFQNAVATALGASWLAMQKKPARSDRAWLGGLLHDVGKSIALRSVAALNAQGKLQLAATDPRLLRVLDLVHTQIGEAVHVKWALPAFLIAACAHHHDQSVPALPENADLHAVRLVSALRLLRTGQAPRRRALAEVAGSALALSVSSPELRALDAQLVVFGGKAVSLAA